jgi:hypothetical protein
MTCRPATVSVSRQFEPIEEIEMDYQAIQNTLTGHTSKDAFKKWKKRRE